MAEAPLPRKAVTQGHVPAFHKFMMVVTLGFWYPIYWMSKRRRRSVTTYK